MASEIIAVNQAIGLTNEKKYVDAWELIKDIPDDSPIWTKPGPASIKGVLDRITGELGTIDILVNCAGIGTWGPAMEANLGDWQAMVDVNLTGVMATIHAHANDSAHHRSIKIERASIVRLVAALINK